MTRPTFLQDMNNQCFKSDIKMMEFGLKEWMFKNLL